MKTSNNYRPVRSPIQPHPAHALKQRAFDTAGNTDHPVRQTLRQFLDKPITLSVKFSEDTQALSALKIPGLLAVRCVVQIGERTIGIGHGSGYISRINRGHERSVFSVLNGALLSAMNAATKSLDALRLEGPEIAQNAMDWRASDSSQSLLATERQKAFLRELVGYSVGSEDEQERILAGIDDMTKVEISSLIQQYQR